jgi:hypothetical protein
MRMPLLALSVLGIAAVAASPAWAPRGPRWNKASAKAEALNGYCRTDSARRRQCLVRRDECLQHAKDPLPCTTAFEQCCKTKG